MSLLTRRAFAASLAAGALAQGVAFARAPGPRVQFWATASGAKTFDATDDGGNPFATALIEAMADPTLDLNGACAAVRQRTSVLSHGAQLVETPGLARAPAWRFRPAGHERRVALVVTFSAYTVPDSWIPLPGAERDGMRMERAFAGAGFATRRVSNASRETLARELAGFAHRAERAEVAAIYCTGHGMEWQGAQYIMPCDHNYWAEGISSLVRAEKWDVIAAAARAPRLNLTIWAGCREYPPT